MAISQSKLQFESRSLADFEALEQTCRLRPLPGCGDKYLFFSAHCNSSQQYPFSGKVQKLLISKAFDEFQKRNLS
jgi:hypothetical protein